MEPQVTKETRPPGLSTRRISRRAFWMLGTNMMPKQQARSRTCMPGERGAPLTTSSVAWRDWKASWEYHFFQAGAAESQSWRTISLGSGVGEEEVDIVDS